MVWRSLFHISDIETPCYYYIVITEKSSASVLPQTEAWTRCSSKTLRHLCLLWSSWDVTSHPLDQSWSTSLPPEYLDMDWVSHPELSPYLVPGTGPQSENVSLSSCSDKRANKSLLNFILLIIKSQEFFFSPNMNELWSSPSSLRAGVSGGVAQCGSGCGAALAGRGGGGGRGLGTGTGPVWAGQEGTGSAWAGTSFRLRPAAPDQQLTDASTSFWEETHFSF